VANEGDLVAVERGMDDGEGVRAGGTFEVFKLEDGRVLAGGELEHGGVAELVAWTAGRSLGVGEREREDDGDGDGCEAEFGGDAHK